MAFFNSQPKTLKQDLRATRKSATRTGFLVILLVSGIVPAFTFLLGGGENESSSLSHQLSALSGILLHTYPFTLAIAIITYSRKQKWFRFGKWFFAALVIIAGATLSNSLSQWTGHALIEKANVVGDYSNPVFGILGGGINYFFGFYQNYGWAPFLASLLVGGFAGSTASRLSRHVPRDIKSSAEGVVRELVQRHRNAA